MTDFRRIYMPEVTWFFTVNLAERKGKTLPTGDDRFSMRWGLVKGNFSRSIENGERLSASLSKRGERGIWQRRFWDYLIRDDADYRTHLDDIHWHPVTHGLVKNVVDWEHSSP